MKCGASLGHRVHCRRASPSGTRRSRRSTSAHSAARSCCAARTAARTRRRRRTTRRRSPWPSRCRYGRRSRPGGRCAPCSSLSRCVREEGKREGHVRADPRCHAACVPPPPGAAALRGRGAPRPQRHRGRGGQSTGGTGALNAGVKWTAQTRTGPFRTTSSAESTPLGPFRTTGTSSAQSTSSRQLEDASHVVEHCKFPLHAPSDFFCARVCFHTVLRLYVDATGSD